MVEHKRKRSWKRRQERIIYLSLVGAAVLLALGIRFATESAQDIQFIFLSLVILLLLGGIAFISRRH